MRSVHTAGDFSVKVITGTRVVLLAMNCPEPRRHGLLGFAISRRKSHAARSTARFLPSQKVFPTDDPDLAHLLGEQGAPEPSTRDAPIQSFLWSDYAVEPGTAYTYSILPMYGAPGALVPDPPVTASVRTEEELDGAHGVWFNRGAVASQEFARRFGNKAPQNPDDPRDPEVQWLSRGLLEAFLGFLDETGPGQGLRVAAYEFTYAPVLEALRAAIDRGVEVRIVYDDTSTEPGTPNEAAIAAAGIPAKVGRRRCLYPRAVPRIPHNKFVLRLDAAGKTSAVWTGSTNFTASGFLGQTNVGHVLVDPKVGAKYLKLWHLLSQDPPRDAARAEVMRLTHDPPPALPAGVRPVFSPRPRSTPMLEWYGDRIRSARTGVMFTAPFGVNATLLAALVEDHDFLRFLLMEQAPDAKLRAALRTEPDVVVSYGAALGQLYKWGPGGEPQPRSGVTSFELEKWLLLEDHYRKPTEGHVFFVHAKVLLVDPVGPRPLTCTGSANFSTDSLLYNDENMLLVNGDTRVADIYLTEFDRLFRHFYFRDIANQLARAGAGDPTKAVFLDATDAWTRSYFTPGTMKSRRREMFFADD